MTPTSPTITFDLNDVRVARPPRAAGQETAERLAVCPFTVVVDTREQLPWTFDGMMEGDKTLFVPTVTRGLPSGDYSIAGMEDDVAVERKSLDDLYGSVTWGRDRFEREIQRLAELPGFAAVVIEATWPEIFDPAATRPGWENRTDPRSVEGTIISWGIRYRNVHWLPAGGRREAEKATFAILRKFWTERHRRKK